MLFHVNGKTTQIFMLFGWKPPSITGFQNRLPLGSPVGGRPVGGGPVGGLTVVGGLGSDPSVGRSQLKPILLQNFLKSLTLQVLHVSGGFP